MFSVTRQLLTNNGSWFGHNFSAKLNIMKINIYRLLDICYAVDTKKVTMGSANSWREKPGNYIINTLSDSLHNDPVHCFIFEKHQ